MFYTNCSIRIIIRLIIRDIEGLIMYTTIKIIHIIKEVTESERVYCEE